MVAAIAAALGRRPPRARVPLWPFLALGRVLEATLPKLGVQPPLHTRRLDFFRKSLVFSTAKASELLGFRPRIDFRRGAADTVEWYRAHGLLPAPARPALRPTETI
jgi:nucleoside-diphosphate-sugar epimerase